MSLRGSTVSLNCGLENPQTLRNMRWWFEQEKVASYERIKTIYIEKYELNKSYDAQFDLIVHDVQLSDAGRYSCAENVGNNSTLVVINAELIVFSE